MQKTLRKNGDGEPMTADEAAAYARQALGEELRALAKKRDDRYTYVGLSRAKSSWGTCDGKGRIRLNIGLVCVPPSLREYVLVHELCHLKQLNHSVAFWSEVERRLPDYRTRRKQLRRYAWVLCLVKCDRVS